jgi:tRNA pseudouridine55 synthase
LSEPLNGFLNINKPLGITSHDVVAQIRRRLAVKKVGHAGTLDPMASGVLIICLGSATRLSEFVMQSVKQYRATVHLGVITDTYDAAGQVVSQSDISQITRLQVEQALAQFLGDIEQMPPMYSAIKQGGRKLYDIARAGGTVEREKRSITIQSLRLSDWQPPRFTLDVTCSAGTYIRSLAYDLGEALGVGAHLAGLIRTASGRFTLEQAMLLDTLLNRTDWPTLIVPPKVALADWRAIQLDDADAERIRHGQPVLSSESPNDSSLALAYLPNAELAAVVRADDGRWLPEKVFLSSE